MSETAKNIIIWFVVIAAVSAIIYGAFKLLSPSYIDKTKYVARNPGFNPYLPRIGSFNIGPGEGISYKQSGQLYSPYASGQEPMAKGHYDKPVANEPAATTEGKANFFALFGA